MNADLDTKYMLDFQAGDKSAFQFLFSKYKKKIINFCYRFCGEHAIAEELAQEVFLKIYKAAPNYRPEAKFSTWIFRIATNVCLNELRKRRPLRQAESLDAAPAPYSESVTREIKDDDQLHPQEILEARERDRFIKKALMALPEKQRLALLLRINQGFSYQEIGKQMKHSENGVKTLIHRGRQNLKKALQAFME